MTTCETLEEIATHEAGHFVMSWHLGYCVTGVEIISNGTEYHGDVHGGNKDISSEEIALLAAGGIAADMIAIKLNAPSRRATLTNLYNEMIGGHANHSCAATGSDPSIVLDYAPDMKKFIRVFEMAVSILQANWEKVSDVQKRLCAKRKITKRIAGNLFRRWNVETEGLNR